MDVIPATPAATLAHPQFTLDLCRYPLAAAAFYTATAIGELNHVRHRAFAARDITPETLTERGFAVEMSELRTGNSNLLLRDDDGALVLVHTYGGEAKGSSLQAAVTVAAKDPHAAESLAERLMQTFIAPDPAPHLVPMTFWTRTSQGPRPVPKLIDSPIWEEIADNYEAQARSGLKGLMAAKALDGGRLILWQGQPGTGKTYALRALARAWRDWCDFHVVVDPDIFFGEDSSYLIDILFLEPRRDHDGKPKARLIVLEDAGELVAADARAETGQALSRLLNVTDGLLGQGLNLCTLITTNEPIDRLHPAVLRPGRCAAQIEVPELDAATANRWLKRHDHTERVSAPLTLAQLFAQTPSATPPPA